MPPAPPPAHAAHADLCRLARAGDAAAADELARAVLDAVRAKALAYERRFRGTVSADDLVGVATLKFPAAIRSYDPAHGSFLNYYLSAACRAMVEFARREVKREGVRGFAAAAPDDRDPAADEPDPLPGRAHAALAGLPRAEQVLFAAIAGIGVRKRSVESVAAALNVPPEDVRAIFNAVAAKVRRRAAAGGNPPGRPACPLSPLIARHAAALRARGLGWKRVAAEVRCLYGRDVGPRGLRHLVARTEMGQN